LPCSLKSDVIAYLDLVNAEKWKDELENLERLELVVDYGVDPFDWHFREDLEDGKHLGGSLT